MPVDIHAFLQEGQNAVKIGFRDFPAMTFPVDEISPAAGKLTEQNVGKNHVQELAEIVVVLSDIPPGKQGSGDDAALYCQAAVPDPDDLDRIGEVERKVIEDAIP